ncbi:MOSC domain-containing protein [Rhizobium halophytocola]|uniref:Uncharacterized protein YcbX n=1 Tax=Rhizobium halophytocola TaxID=735519 RepID=A0ABS4DYR2_9HYPH|nr:MOSC domain-containing protein [Rhizobium halophytocola]MBP1850824.1 uncharacterized protein YcbX [Rhizobium halophytocola]
MQVSSLHVYPLKSGRVIDLDQAMVEPSGLAGDRRMMLVAPDGHFMTQRELPDIARITVIPEAAGDRLLFDDGRSTTVAVNPSARLKVSVWKSTVEAATVNAAVDVALSDWLGRPVRLVVFDDTASRVASPEWAGTADSPVTFADGFQVLVTTTGSLAALNADMDAKAEGSVPMARFRPNIVIDCDTPWAEDGWAAIDIGGIRFDLVKPCARCIMTTQDQSSGARDGANPMPAMQRLRFSTDRRVPGPIFGWNAVPRASGLIAVGAEARVLADNPARWPLKQRPA